MKLRYALLSVYLTALLLCILGALIDSDVRTGSFGFLIFEVLLMSIIVFAMLSIVLFGPYYFCLFMKRRFKKI